MDDPVDTNYLHLGKQLAYAFFLYLFKWVCNPALHFTWLNYPTTYLHRQAYLCPIENFFLPIASTSFLG